MNIRLETFGSLGLDVVDYGEQFMELYFPENLLNGILLYIEKLDIYYIVYGSKCVDNIDNIPWEYGMFKFGNRTLYQDTGKIAILYQDETTIINERHRGSKEFRYMMFIDNDKEKDLKSILFNLFKNQLNLVTQDFIN